MGSGDCNAVAKAHELSEHLSPGHDRDTLFRRGDDFRIVASDRVGNDHNISTFHVIRIVTEPDLCALLG